jgi:hypothetical protein
MQNIHKMVKVINNQVIVDLPPEFSGHEVEVILRSPKQKDTLTQEIEREIDIGIESPVSLRNHREIFDNLREKYGPC